MESNKELARKCETDIRRVETLIKGMEAYGYYPELRALSAGACENLYDAKKRLKAIKLRVM